MIGIAPISYLLPRVVHSYTIRLAATNPSHLFHTILHHDQCQYSADHFTPDTTLTSIHHSLANTLPDATYVPPLLLTWSHPNAVLFPSLSTPADRPPQALYYVPSTHNSTPIIHIVARTTHNTFTLLRTVQGLDCLHAIGIAVTLSVRHYDNFSTHHYIHTRSFEEKLTSPKPHRLSPAYHTLRTSLSDSPSIHYILWYDTRAKDSPNTTQRQHWTSRFAASPQPAPLPPPSSPRNVMWQKIQADYIPLTHPAALACQTPDNGKPVDAIKGSLTVHSRIATSAIPQIATGHCFDAEYSARFRPSADDNTTCPCSTPLHTHLHTRHHVLFKCARYAHMRRKLIPRPWRLAVILQSKDASAKLSLFLKDSGCSLLRPLPTPASRSPPTSPITTLNPEPP